jgi:hypothetical protein
MQEISQRVFVTVQQEYGKFADQIGPSLKAFRDVNGYIWGYVANYNGADRYFAAQRYMQAVNLHSQEA